jgi:hypothetical protein
VQPQTDTLSVRRHSRLCSALTELALYSRASADTCARVTLFGSSIGVRNRALKWSRSGMRNPCNSSKLPYTCWRRSVAHGEIADVDAPYRRAINGAAAVLIALSMRIAALVAGSAKYYQVNYSTKLLLIRKNRRCTSGLIRFISVNRC